MNEEKKTSENLPEITVKAVILGIFLSVILAGANAYLGLFAGMTVSASIPAAVISMALLGLFKKSNILENNLVQTAASAGESLAAGVIFTLPALIIMGHWTEFNYWETTIIAALGGVLGVLFTVPLRKVLIVEENLKFPEGVATAEVLKTGQDGSGIKYIAYSAIAGALFKFGETGLRVWTGTVEAATRMGSGIAYFGSNLSPALVSVGYIVGLNIAILVFLGGAINWFFAIPIYAMNHPWPVGEDGNPMAAADWAWTIWSTKTRYLGVGAMVVGGIWALINLRSPIVKGVKKSLAAYKKGSPESKEVVPRTEQDAPMKWVGIALLLSLFPIFGVYYYVIGSIVPSILMAVIMLVAGFLFSAVAAYMAGLVGSSNNPISGVTIATILFTSLLLFAILDPSKMIIGPAAAIFVGAVVACAAAIGGDNLQDLKAGHILGATPWKQQVMQMIGVISAALVIAPMLSLIQKAYGIGAKTAENPDSLAAPQAGLMASVAEGVFAQNLPWGLIGIGMVIAIVVIVLDKIQEKKGSSFRLPVLAVAVGVYLPFELSVPILLGGLIAWAAQSYRNRKKVGASPEQAAKIDAATEKANTRGLLFASGLITGEALVGILMAIPIVLSGDKGILAIVDKPLGAWPGVILLVFVMLWLASVAHPKKDIQEIEDNS